jgi:hypothetical protein
MWPVSSLLRTTWLRRFVTEIKLVWRQRKLQVTLRALARILGKFAKASDLDGLAIRKLDQQG